MGVALLALSVLFSIVQWLADKKEGHKLPAGQRPADAARQYPDYARVSVARWRPIRRRYGFWSIAETWCYSSIWPCCTCRPLTGIEPVEMYSLYLPIILRADPGTSMAAK